VFVAGAYGNHRVIVFDADTGAFKRMWGAFGNKPVDDDSCENVPKPDFKDPNGPQNLSIVHSIRVANDGMVYIADRENRRVQMFTNEGKFLKQQVKTQTPFARNVSLSPDPAQEFLYVGDGKEIAILDRKTLDIVAAVKGEGVIGGAISPPPTPTATFYVAATGAGMQRLTFKGIRASRRRRGQAGAHDRKARTNPTESP